jgi:hypothetical protein
MWKLITFWVLMSLVAKIIDARLVQTRGPEALSVT